MPDFALSLGLDGKLSVSFATAVGSTTGESAAAAVAAGTPALLFAGISSGLPKLFIDEEEKALTGAATRTGGLVVTSADTESVGAGTGEGPIGVAGLYGRYELWPRAPTRTWCAIRSRFERDSADMVGIGEEEAFGDNAQSAVAVPIRAEIEGTTDLDVLASAYDPSTPATMALQSVSDGSHSDNSIVSGRARVVPEAGYTGFDRAPYVIRKGLKDSTSRLILSITDGGGGVPVTDFPYGPWTRMPALPARGAANRQDVSTKAGLVNAIGAAQTGRNEFIVLPAGTTASIDLDGAVAINKAMTGSNRLFITSDTSSADPGQYCRFHGGRFTFNGARGIVMNGFRFDGGNRYIDDTSKFELSDAEFCQFERAHIYNVIGGGTGRDTGYFGACFRIDCTGNAVHDILWGFILYESSSGMMVDVRGSGSSLSASTRPTRLLITHCHNKGMKHPGSFIKPGRHASNHGIHDIQLTMQRCLDTEANNIDSQGRGADFLELKFTGVHVRDCTQITNKRANGLLQWKIRNGRKTTAPGVPGPAEGDIFEGNLFIVAGTSREQAPLISVRGAHHKIINNWCVLASSIGDNEPSSSHNLGGAHIQLTIGDANGQTYPETDETGGQPNAYRAIVGGNRGFTVASANPGGDTIKPRACIVAPANAARTDRNTTVNTSDPNFDNFDFNTAIAGAQYTKVPIRMRSGSDAKATSATRTGPQGWQAGFILA